MSRRPTLCLLPGLMCDASVWTPQIEALSHERAVFVPNFLGLDRLEEMAASVLAATSGPLAVAGHSMGGRVAFEVFRQAPERVERIALLDTGVHGVRDREHAGRQRLIDLAYAEGMGGVVREWLPPMVHPDRAGETALVGPMAAMIMRVTPADFEKQQHALLHRRDLSDLLPRIRVPAAVMTGRQDVWSPPAQHEDMAAAMPNAVLTIIEDSGHMSPLERPTAVNRVLEQWLAA